MELITYALLKKQLGSLSNDVEAEISELGSGFEVKGVVETTSALPASGDLGDLYMVSGEGYASYVWDGSDWQLKDGDYATTAEIDAALYS